MEGDLGPDCAHLEFDDVYVEAGIWETLGLPSIGEDDNELVSEDNVSGDGMVAGGAAGADAKLVDMDNR